MNTATKTKLYTSFKTAIKPIRMWGISSIWPFSVVYRFIIRHIVPDMEKVVEVNGYHLKIRIGNGRDAAGIGAMLLSDTVHDPVQTSMFKDFIKPGMTIVDVGANIGYYTLLAASLTGETGKVYSIEPEQGNMDVLMENVLLNGYQNVTPILGAAGNRNGIADLYVSGISSGSHSIAIDRADGGHKVKVPVFTLDNIFPQGTPVHLVKSDTEGNDMDVMRGARRVIRENKGIVWTMEVWPSGLSKINESVDSLFALVRANGFTRAVMMDERGGKFIPCDIDNPEVVRNYTQWHNSCNVIFTRGRDWNADTK